jgi:hypothetical protein
MRAAARHLISFYQLRLRRRGYGDVTVEKVTQAWRRGAMIGPILRLPWEMTTKLQAIVLVLASLVLPAAAGSEDILGWCDLQARANKASASDKRSEFVVTTKSGEKYKSRYVGFGPAGIGLRSRGWFALPNYPDTWIPSAQVAEVLVRHRGRLSYFGVIEHHFECLGDFGCLFDPIPVLVFPIDLAGQLPLRQCFPSKLCAA